MGATGRHGVRTRFLFVCVENAGRSQMAEAFARRAGLDAASAGTVPAGSVNRVVIEAMAEKGLDLSANEPKMLSFEMIDRADVVVTMGCSVEKVCPRPMLDRMQKKVVDWGLEDPKAKGLPEIRRIRDEIERMVEELARFAQGSS
ncbi:MAG: arsenate reductase ArsC [Nitrososphaerota archaeon]|jgi:protein-tyrosine-phosphatase|nr:arsenate reductase ArsC [Nitrososphaerota archaeon]MDG6920869.1 arsenate reductase ArsC [Nitrososphaerota archaeon]MDG6949456.1 arsenate reductase ArsC [Nitrososphaerota archaeon]